MNREDRNSPSKMDVDGNADDSSTTEQGDKSAAAFTTGSGSSRPQTGTSRSSTTALLPAPQDVATLPQSKPDQELKDLILRVKDLDQWDDGCQFLLDNNEFGLLKGQCNRFIQNARTMAEKDQTIREKDQTIREKDQTIRTMGRKIAENSLLIQVNDRRPLHNMTGSAPHVINLLHPPASIVRIDYDYDDESIKLPTDAPYTRIRDTTIQSEIDVQSIVAKMLEALMGRWGDKIKLYQNRRVVGTECDILLAYGPNNIPFSCTEIKKNGKKKEVGIVRAIFVDDNEVDSKLKGRVQGEHLTQLQVIQLFGLNKVFGMISDGNRSMITCTSSFSKDDLPNEQDLAGNAKPPKKRSIAEAQGDGEPLSPDNAIKFANTSSASMQQSNEGNGTRQIFCSNYSDVIRDYGENGTQTLQANWLPSLKLFAHYLHLAFNSVDPHQFTRNIEINKTLPARSIELNGRAHDKKGELVFESDMFAQTSVRFKEEPDVYNCLLSNAGVTIIKLFRNLGMGTNGDCCWGTTESGNSFCAVKFFADRRSAVGLAMEEQAAWNSIYDELPKALVVTFPAGDDYNGKRKDACVCMPYLIPIDGKEGRAKALQSGTLHAGLTAFAEKNYLHLEAHQWRHWGMFRTRTKTTKQNAEYKAFLCDLGNLEKRNESTTDAEWKKRTEEWIEYCLSELSKSIPKE